MTIGIKIPKDLDLKTFSVEQHRLFKLAVSMYVKNLFPDFSPFADSLRFEVDDQLWLKSPKEEDRRAKLQTALGFDGKYELTLEADGAGCVPVNPDCTDERKCEWESNRIYSVMKNDAQICCGKWVIDKYNALSKGRGYDPIGQNHKVGTLPIVVYHRVTFLPPPRKPK